MTNKYLDLLAYFGIGGAHPGGFPLTQALLGDVSLQPTDHVLELGCGTGQTAEFISKKFHCEVVGLDNHPIMVEEAKGRLVGSAYPVQVMLGNAEKLPFADESFDFILAESVLSFTNIPVTIQEAARVLKPGGRLLIIEMTAEQPPTEELQKETSKLYGITKLLVESEWENYLQQAGLTLLPIKKSTDMEPTDLEDIRPSDNLDLSLYDVWDEHNDFLARNGNLVGYRIFFSKKH